MATKVEESGVEVEEKLRLFAPQLIGLRNLAELSVGAEPGDMTPQAHEQVMQAIARYDRRVKLLKAHRDSVAALITDGHPDLPPTQIDADALVSIQKNAATVQLAAGTFVGPVPPDPAARLDLTPGPTEPK